MHIDLGSLSNIKVRRSGSSLWMENRMLAGSNPGEGSRKSLTWPRDDIRPGNEIVAMRL